jgi:competence protein ComEA
MSWFTIFAILLSTAHFLLAEPTPNGGVDESGLMTYTNCQYIATEWADGDSFRVRFPDGSDYTLRLYGADCIEWHVNTESDARRLREQRRFFGLSGSMDASVALARRFGETAAAHTKKLLAQPFTVHTAFADALGDKRYKRVYGFITISDGRDLATILVTEGLARAHGVYRLGPQGVTANEYREQLRDLELIAAKTGRGIWEKTDWQRLQSERQAARDEEAELTMAVTKKSATTANRINPNTATHDELMTLPGIGAELATRIIEGRSKGTYRSASDLDRISGIGPGVIARLTPYLVFTN